MLASAGALCCVLGLDTLSSPQDRKTSKHDQKVVDWNIKHQHKQNMHNEVLCPGKSVGR